MKWALRYPNWCWNFPYGSWSLPPDLVPIGPSATGNFSLPDWSSNSKSRSPQVFSIVGKRAYAECRGHKLCCGYPEGYPRALQASECHELLNPTRTSCLILAQRQPGKLFELCTNLLFDGLTYFTDLVQINYPRIWWTLWHRITLHYIGIKHLHVGPKPYKKLQEWPWGHLDGNWSSFQLAKSTPPQSVIDHAIAPSARMSLLWRIILKSVYVFIHRSCPVFFCCGHPSVWWFSIKIFSCISQTFSPQKN